MLSDLQAAICNGTTLRRTQTNDKSSPSLADSMIHEWEAEKNEAYFLDLGLEQWLPFVNDLTFATSSVPLTQDDARLLRACYKHLHGYAETNASLPPSLVTQLADLGRRLQPALAKYTSSNGGAFCKLSGRSAKDAPLHTARLSEAHVVRCEATAANDGEARLACLFDASLGLMRVREVAHCLWLLVNSQRVDEDLDVALRHPERWEQHVVFRAWWEGVSTDLEFRMFVVDGVPTGLTQYNHLLHSPRLCANAERLATACCAYYHAAVWPRLEGTTFDRKTGSRFVVDFAVHPDALAGEDPRIADEHIRLIELNCFYESTGMGMFDYQKDAKQLAEGPFECRVRTARLPHAAVTMENEWRALLRGEVDSSAHTDAAWRQLEEATQ